MNRLRAWLRLRRHLDLFAWQVIRQFRTVEADVEIAMAGQIELAQKLLHLEETICRLENNLEHAYGRLQSALAMTETLTELRTQDQEFWTEMLVEIEDRRASGVARHENEWHLVDNNVKVEVDEEPECDSQDTPPEYEM